MDYCDSAVKPKSAHAPERGGAVLSQKFLMNCENYTLAVCVIRMREVMITRNQGFMAHLIYLNSYEINIRSHL